MKPVVFNLLVGIPTEKKKNHLQVAIELNQNHKLRTHLNLKHLI